MLFDPIIEYNNIIRWLGQYVNQETTPKKFTKQLRKFLNQRHEIKLSVSYTDNTLDSDDFTVAALYDVWNDEDGKKPIVFSFIINHPLDESWLITQSIADELAMEIIEALTHEYQHVYQYRVRNYMLSEIYKSSEEDLELRAEQEYLGQLDEIDAYAANIAVRMHIRKDSNSLDLKKYKEAFGSDHWVVRRLLKKISKRLHYLENHCTSIEI